MPDSLSYIPDPVDYISVPGSFVSLAEFVPQSVVVFAGFGELLSGLEHLLHQVLALVLG